jgi:hypothetical protein
MATTSIRSVLVGVFDEHRRAQAAQRSLLELGFTPRQLGCIVRHGELLDATGALAHVDPPEHDLTGGLIGLGLPVHQARAVALDFETGRTVVTVQVEQPAEVAQLALQSAGAKIVLNGAVTRQSAGLTTANRRPDTDSSDHR